MRIVCTQEFIYGWNTIETKLRQKKIKLEDRLNFFTHRSNHFLAKRAMVHWFISLNTDVNNIPRAFIARGFLHKAQFFHPLILAPKALSVQGSEWREKRGSEKRCRLGQIFSCRWFYYGQIYVAQLVRITTHDGATKFHLC